MKKPMSEVSRLKSFPKMIKNSLPNKEDIFTETNTRLRIHSMLYTNESWIEQTRHLTMTPLSKLTKSTHSLETLSSDFITLGVLYELLEMKKSIKNGKNYRIARFTNLNDVFVNLFLFDSQCQLIQEKQDLGYVFAFLNPNLMHPADALSALGFSIDKKSQLLKLGMSVDFGFCKGDGHQDCGFIIDT
jgi:hypothetical protein